MAVTINGTTGLAVGTGSVTFPDSSTQNTAATGFGFKNRIINGAMMIDQRNAGASVTVSNGTVTYITDRWNVYEDTSGAISSQQSSTAPEGFTNSLLISVTSAGSATSGQICRLQQRVEGFNVADFGFGTAAAKTFTVFFWVRSSLTGTYCVNFRNNAADRSYVATYTISAANTWEQKSVTVAGDTSGTWLTTNGVGMFVSFDLGSGSNANTTAGAWTAADKQNTSAQANWIGTASSTFYITGVQLEKGSTATSFDYRPYGTELALCQRYYEYGTMYGVSYNSSGVQVQRSQMNFQILKRSTPSVTVSVATGSLTSPSVASGPTLNGAWVGFGSASGGLEGSFSWTASSEL